MWKCISDDYWRVSIGGTVVEMKGVVPGQRWKLTVELQGMGLVDRMVLQKPGESRECLFQTAAMLAAEDLDEIVFAADRALDLVEQLKK